MNFQVTKTTMSGFSHNNEQHHYDEGIDISRPTTDHFGNENRSGAAQEMEEEDVNSIIMAMRTGNQASSFLGPTFLEEQSSEEQEEEDLQKIPSSYAHHDDHQHQLHDDTTNQHQSALYYSSHDDENGNIVASRTDGWTSNTGPFCNYDSSSRKRNEEAVLDPLQEYCRHLLADTNNQEQHREEQDQASSTDQQQLHATASAFNAADPTLQEAVDAHRSAGSAGMAADHRQ